MTEIGLGPLSRTAVRYMDFMKGKAPRTSEPGFSLASWDELARLVDTENFVRVGRHGETTNWPQTVEFMHRFIGIPKSYRLRGAMEVDNRVFLELEETITHEGERAIFNSVYVISFNDAGRITRLEFFQQ